MEIARGYEAAGSVTVSEPAPAARPGEATIEQILADIDTLDRDIAVVFFGFTAKLMLTEPKVMEAMAPARHRANAARLAGDSWTSEALTRVHAAAMRRVEEVYPDWPAMVERLELSPEVEPYFDVPMRVADIATMAALMAIEGNSFSRSEVFMHTSMWNDCVAKGHPVLPPPKPRGSLLAKIFGPG